jgi:serine/threonine-protein kinase HipA
MLEGLEARVLLVKRFDRLPSRTKLHFEEFNQLLGRRSDDDKYDASYEDMAAFLRETPGCTPVDVWRLYSRILACLLTGNTDAHLKNFAMFHTTDGLRLTPAYDLVSAALYPDFKMLALAMGGNANILLTDLKPKQLVGLGRAYGLDDSVLLDSIEKLNNRRKATEKAVIDAARKIDAEALANTLLELMERRWNRSFASTGHFLSKKQSGDGTA